MLTKIKGKTLASRYSFNNVRKASYDLGRFVWRIT